MTRTGHFYIISLMGKHWPHALKVRGLWPDGTTLADLPELWADQSLGELRQKWFASYVRIVGDCDEWMGSRQTGSSLPYGKTSIAGRGLFAHRVAYTLHYREDPGDLQVCHRCDNAPCTKGEHLFLGTHGDNIRDMVAKGRNRPPKGEGHPHSVLTVEQVRELRRLYALGQGTRALAEEFGIARMTAKYAIFGITWAHVDEPIPEPHGAAPFGEMNPNTKLTDAKVRKMRHLFAEKGWSKRRLAREFGVDSHTVRDMIAGKTWNHVE